MTFFDVAGSGLAMCVLFGILSYFISLLFHTDIVKDDWDLVKWVTFTLGAVIFMSAVSGAVGVLAVAGGLMEMALRHL